MKLVELGVTQRNDWERCPCYHYHAYMMGELRQGLVLGRDALPLIWGTIGHAGLSAWYNDLRFGSSIDKATANAEQTMINLREAIVGEWFDEQGVSRDHADDQDARALKLVSSFVKGYADYFSADANWDITVIEKEFSIPAGIFYPTEILEQTCLDWGLEKEDFPNVRGTIDLCVQTEHGILVVDHKFLKYIVRDLEVGLAFWKQPNVYCRAAELLFGNVRGYVHNQIRKPTGLKRRASLKTFESEEEFLTRLYDEYLSYPDYYETYPSNKKGYFARSDPLSAFHNSEKFLTGLCNLDAEIITAYKRIPEPEEGQQLGPPPPHFTRRDPTVACNKYGKVCDYINLCSFGYTPATMEIFIDRHEPHF